MVRLGATSDEPRRLVHLDAEDVGDLIEVGVECKERGAVAVSDRGNHAVDHSSGGDSHAPAGSVDASRGVEVHCRVEPQEVETEEQAPQVGFPLVAASPGDHLHDDGLSYRNPAVAGDELGEPSIDWARRCPVVLHPGRGVDEDHAALVGAMSFGISSIACAPRIANASSRDIG